MKEITLTIDRVVTTTMTRELSMKVDDDFNGFSDEELDLLLKDEIYDVSDKVDYISLEVEYDVETLKNSEGRPIGNIVVSDEYGNNEIQKHTNN